MISKAKQLASITAAGVSAIALTAGKAEAAIIDSGILNTGIVFFSNSDPTGHNIVVSSRLFATFASGPALKFRAISNSRSTGSYSRKIVISRGGVHNTGFGIKSGGGVDHFPFGAAWGAATEQGGVDVSIGGRSFGSFSGTGGHPSFTDQYFLFRFNGTSVMEYGWIEASLSVTRSTSAAASDGPSITIVQYAFDNSGVEITGGQGAASATPEPSSIAESSLAALILGAEGLRRWRKARKAICT
jgi:hypothetical protein